MLSLIENTTFNELLSDRIDFYRLDANRKINPKNRSEMGQFMTPAPVALFMASLFKELTGDIKLLDAGAGIGSLTTAFVDEVIKRNVFPESIKCITYELDAILAEYLKMTLSDIKKQCGRKGIHFCSEIRESDFVQSGADLLAADLFNVQDEYEKFTHIIMNPPYKKINSNSKHRKLLRSIGVETSNLYTGFLALAIKLLEKGGELVTIAPRSFCNGPYFRPFRELLLSQTTFTHIHVFESRIQNFKDDGVLQENIIFHATKGKNIKNVKITSSQGSHFSKDSSNITEDMTQRVVSIDDIIKANDPERFIHIATSKLEQNIVDRLSIFHQNLENIEIGVSTGPVVDFRLKDDLSPFLCEGSVPLLYPTHFELGYLHWPKDTKKPNAIRISKKSKKWLWKNEGYFVVTKRFTSKEEKRRLVASVYESHLPGDLIGFENHLNIFHKNKQGMSKEIAYGLATYLNSTLLDRYFRQFNGHTQVNSTDLRSIHYPKLETLMRIGERVNGTLLNQQETDTIMDEEINKMSNNQNIDPTQAQKKIDEALTIIKALGLPKGQHNERTALTLLAILNLTPGRSWKKAEKPLIGITPIMEFCKEEYGKEYAPNTRETFRRQTMHQFVDAGIALYNPDSPERPVNSPKACYQISPDAFNIMLAFGTRSWKKRLNNFLQKKATLAQKYAKEREMNMIPLEVIKGTTINLTPGAHSQLIKDIISEFGPRFAPGSEVIYVGDTGDKIGYFQKDRLKQFGVKVDTHGKMPDVVLYYEVKNWLLLIESVTSHGPVDGKRHGELSKLFESANPGLVYVTAFPNRSLMGKYLAEISWEIEVWVADAPTHLIHFDGSRFLGPYEG